jgi:hypothetical protein
LLLIKSDINATRLKLRAEIRKRVERISLTFDVLAIAFCSLLFLRLAPSTAFAQTAQEIARTAFGSTVLLVMEDANGQPLSLGSGFCVGNGELASNVHVIEGAVRGYAKVVGETTKYDIEGIAGLSPERDLVVLKISGGCSQALSLGNSDAVQVGDSVYAVGNPEGLEGTFSQGIVSGIREVGSNKLLQITAPISPGSSGGPVLNEKGEVIGVSVATFRDGQNLNFAVPSIFLKELLNKSGPLMPLEQAKAQKSALADVAGRGNDGVVGEKFTWDGLIGGQYSFSIHNLLRESVKDVSCLVIFYDKANSPVDFSQVTYSVTIPGGLSKRVTGMVGDSTRMLSSPPAQSDLAIPVTGWPTDSTRLQISPPPEPKVEIRILNFQIVQ